MNQRATDKANTVTSQPQGEGKTESDQTANKEGGARKESNLKLRRQPQRQTRRDTQQQGEGRTDEPTPQRPA